MSISYSEYRRQLDDDDWEEEEERKRKRRSSGANSDVAGSSIGFLMNLIAYTVYYSGWALGYVGYHTIAHAPAILAGYCGAYYLKQPLAGLTAHDTLIQWVSGIMIACLTYAFIFYLKGFMQALRMKGNYTWWIILLILVGITCIVPGLLTRAVLLKIESFEVLKYSPYLSWLVVAGVAAVVYARYNFHKDSCPRLVYWAYRLGAGTAGKVVDMIKVS